MVVIFLSAGKQRFCQQRSRGHFPSYIFASELLRMSVAMDKVNWARLEWCWRFLKAAGFTPAKRFSM